MANADAKPAVNTETAPAHDDSLLAQVHDWIRNQAPWWATSFMLHMFALSTLLLIGHVMVSATPDDAPAFESAALAPAPDATELDRFPLADPQVDPGLLRPDELLDQGQPGTSATISIGDPAGDVAPSGAPGGELTGDQFLPHPGSPSFDSGPKQKSGPGRGPGGPGGPGDVYKNRLGPHRIGGGTHLTEQSVQAALSWLYRHQMREGNWSLRDYQKRCTDKSCTGPGGEESISGATAMSILPFLAAGQTHTNGVPRYRQAVFAGLYWLMNHQAADGDLSAGASSQMYSHALASIALCEAYGMTKDKTVGVAAQRSLNFIQAAQNSKTGGWRYHPGEEGDTSVVGWQLMALKSGQMAGLIVNPAAMEGTKKWLLIVSKNQAGGSSGAAGNGQFSYQADGAPTPTMSAVGLLCNQYLHVGRSDPVIVGGVRYLMGNLPAEDSRNMYYWYYATQVLHNMLDKDWDTWNRKMREILVTEQIRTGCATGSWDPDRPTRDAWGPHGGRVMMTSLATLTLEVYYRNLAVYKNDQPDPFEKPAAVKATAKEGGK